MKLLEYEAKAILHSADIPVPAFSIIQSVDTTCSLPVVLKSQVPVGGRGKSGGIQVVDSAKELRPIIKTLLSLPVKGFTPKVLLAEERLEIKQEYYLSLVINKSTATIELLAHINGGVEVEENDPESFLTISLNSKEVESAGEQLAEYFNIPSQSFVLQDIVNNLHHCFIENDITFLEINPLIYTADGKIIAADCKMTLDDAAAFRHPDWQFEGQLTNTNFVTLNPNGSVATIANGAGLAMATVDAVANSDMIPANFLDIGGGANSASILMAFQKITEYPSVKAIVINIFAGITKCDEVAKAIIEAKQHINNLPTLYIRLTGTNIELAKELLEKHQIPLLPTLDDCLAAAKKEVDNG